MLEGFDKDWIYTNASKPFADYTNLDPDEYIFKVKGSNNDGVWNETPATIRLIITPPFWQTGWFRILMVAAIGAIIYGVYRYRLREVIRLQMIRNNIASDLHDEVGSTLNSISILSSVAKQQAGRSLPALDQIGENSRKIVEAMNDIVWTINPENDSFEKILVRMRSFAHQVMKAKQIEFRFDADEKMDDLSMPMQTRKNFYLIFKEATINIAKYSSASHANFSVTGSDHQIQLTIRDNGIGFDTNNTSSGNGIKNMQRRANEIKADLKIESAAGEGTRVELVLKT
jgi:signal transduction histidine kinase